MSRSIDDLEPGTRAKVALWLSRCAARGVEILVYCTQRSPEEQDELYQRGRTKPGPIVTNARPWQSWHQYGRAVDAVPLLPGNKPLWRYDGMRYEWQVFSDEAEHVGLEWAGRWRSFREYVHVQDTGGMTLAQAYQSRQAAEPVATATDILTTSAPSTTDPDDDVIETDGVA